MVLLDRFRLDDKVALITGGGRGLGRAIALALGEAGAETVIIGRTASDLHTTAQRVQRFGRRCHAIEADIAQSEELETLFENVLDEFGRVDILVNAAAIGRPAGGHTALPDRRAFLDTSPDEWKRVLEVNLHATISLCQLVAPQMIQLGGGKVINVASANALHRATDFEFAFGAAQAAVQQLTRTLAQELGPHGIHVNCIAPGDILTEEQAAGPHWTPARQAAAGKRIAVGRLGEEEDVGPLAVYLARPASDFVTGATFAIDGGGMVLPPISGEP